MKVYVGYEDHTYDGYSKPQKVFDKEEKAWEWMKTGHWRRDYEELEVE